ncbi:unnamed protein product, partial [Vitrella brassicaformis CCMP3155]
ACGTTLEHMVLRPSTMGVSRPLSAAAKPLPTHVDVAIVGGGLGGLLLCAGLRCRGIDAHVFERAPALRNASQGMFTASTNGIHASTHAGEEVKTIRVDRKGKGEVSIRWTKAQNIFASHVPDEVIHCSCGGRDFTEDDTGATLVFEGRNEQVRAKMIVAVDGAFSALRPQILSRHREKRDGVKQVTKDGGQGSAAAALMIEDPPKYHGFLNWNALVKKEDIARYAESAGVLLPYTERGMFIVTSDCPNVLAFIVDVGTHVFWQIRVPESSKAGHRAVAGRQGLKEHLLRGLRDATDLAVPIGQEAEKPQIPAGETQPNMSEIICMVGATPEEKIYERCIYGRAATSTITTPKGRVIMIGDAAHAPYPGPGQGANMTFEDVSVLIDMFEKHVPNIRAPNTATVSNRDLTNGTTHKPDLNGHSNVELPAVVVPTILCECESIRLPRMQSMVYYADIAAWQFHTQASKIKDCRTKFNDWVKTFPPEGPPPSLEPFEPFVPRKVFRP